ncbi:MAG TPA: DUF1289 domain-containing protein [Stellaceae bacterium]|nr:DUF1289 domain-containing protein [Stellaceae bacterium]
MSETESLSPCVAVCVLDPATGYCRGCLRTIAEISHWMLLSREQKHSILAALPARRRGLRVAEA